MFHLRGKLVCFAREEQFAFVLSFLVAMVLRASKERRAEECRSAVCAVLATLSYSVRLAVRINHGRISVWRRILDALDD